MTTGLDRIIEAINLSLDRKIECLRLKHPDTPISSSEMSIINSYRTQLVAHATQIYIVGNHAIDEAINDALNKVNHTIMRSLNNAIMPEQIEWVVTHGLYPDLIIDKTAIAFVEKLPKSTIDTIFKILGKENIINISSQIQELEDILQNLFLETENIKIECTVSNSSEAVAISNVVVVGDAPFMEIEHLS